MVRLPEPPPVKKPFQIPVKPGGVIGRPLLRLLKGPMERALGLSALNDIYDWIRAQPTNNFYENGLASLGVRLEVDDSDLAMIPPDGPLIVVANHPFGGLEGVALGALMLRVRGDSKLLVNEMLSRIGEMHETCFFVDSFDRPEFQSANAAAIRGAMRWLRNGGALGLFPAGEVSHATWRNRHISDPVWQETAARLALRYGAAVVPVYFDGRNSLVFQAAGLVHPRLRTAMLPRELLARRKRSLRAEIGTPIEAGRLTQIGDASEVTGYLRVRTYLLRERQLAQRSVEGSKQADLTPIEAPRPIALLDDEIARLPGEQCLLESGRHAVLVARAKQIPNVLHEIGRQRERSFRLVGEGTGRPIDIDRFDETYWHLFVWDRTAHEIIGAYRLGPSDEILPRDGIDGFYCNTLFKFTPALLEQLDPALEMGRSFVRPEAQRSFAGLNLLWQGIGHFVAAHPRYRHLFGPVSISREYQSMSRMLLVAFLRSNRFLESFSELLKPRNPVRFKPERHWNPRDTSVVVSDLDEVDRLIRELESDVRGVPILIRQYLRLGSRFLGFNVDPEFSDVIDALVVTDLVNVNRRLLKHYMGKDAVAKFLSFHAEASGRWRRTGEQDDSPQPSAVNPL